MLDKPTENCYQVFKQGHIRKGGGFKIDGTKSWVQKTKSMEIKKYILHKYDILIAMTDMKGNVAILGNTALMEFDDEYVVNQRVGLIRSNGYNNTSFAYIYLLTNNQEFLNDLRNRANSGVQVNLSKEAIISSSIIIPSKQANNEFNSLVVPLMDKIIANDIESINLISIRDLLLPKLMSGEIDVSKIDI